MKDFSERILELSNPENHGMDMMMTDRLDILDRMVEMHMETMMCGRVRAIVNSEDYEQKKDDMP